MWLPVGAQETSLYTLLNPFRPGGTTYRTFLQPFFTTGGASSPCLSVFGKGGTPSPHEVRVFSALFRV